MKHATSLRHHPALASLLTAGLLACTVNVGADGTDDDTTAAGSTGEPGSTSAPGSTTAVADDTTASPDETGGSTTGSTGEPEDTGEPGSSSETGSDESTGETGEACALAEIELPGDAFYPEGIAATASGTLYVGSLATGAIVQVTPCETEVETFVEVGTTTRNVVGMVVDDAAGLLWVCDSDFAFTTAPAVQAYDLVTGDLVATHDFEAIGFCNDLALGADGSVYATDSAAARIIRVAAADRLLDTPVETWANDPEFAVAPGEFGLNGIVLGDDDTVYAVNYAQGELYRIPVLAGGAAGAVSLLGIQPVPSLPDGLKALAPDQLLVVEGGTASLSLIDIAGDAAVVSVVENGFDAPTTAAVVGPDAWVVQGQLDHLLGLDPAPPTVPFTVVRVALPR